jgi:hypothetical protein
MARQSKSDREQSIVNAVVRFVKDVEDETLNIRQEWSDNHQVFEHGTISQDKEDWQSDYSINKLGSAVRAAHSQLKRILINNPDWYDLDPVNPNDERAAQLAGPLKKFLDYHLDTANFPRYASTFILNSLISMGAMLVGWKPRRLRNPEWVMFQAEKQQAEMRKRGTGVTTLTPELTSGQIEESATSAIERLRSIAQGEDFDFAQEEPDKFVEIGGLDFQIPIAENIGWDTNATYMEESEVQYYRTTMRLHELDAWAKQGFIKKSKVKEVGGANQLPAAQTRKEMQYKGTTTQKTGNKSPSPEVDIIVWFGPLVMFGAKDDRMKFGDEDHMIIIANERTLLKEGPSPFWEPKNQKGPLVYCSAREVPHKAVGTTPVMDAKAIQKVFDSNNQLLTDTMRYGVVGINVVDEHSVVDKTIFEEGIEPGAIVRVQTDNNDVSKVWRHEPLTSNVENQAKPVQNEIRSGISESVGISGLSTAGSNNLRSRTTASEISAQQQGTQITVDQISVDLEIQFLNPFLEKALSRLIQFGLSEVRINPELKNVLTEEEIEVLASISDEERAQMLYSFYKFKIKGFSFQADHQERISRINELFSIGGTGGPVGELMPWKAALTRWLKEMDMDDVADALDPNTELSIIQRENQMLVFENRPVQVLPQDNHERHIQSHSNAGLGSGGQTPALQQHLQQHQQILQQIQAQEQAQQQQQRQLNGQQSPNGQQLLPQ